MIVKYTKAQKGSPGPLAKVKNGGDLLRLDWL